MSTMGSNPTEATPGTPGPDQTQLAMFCHLLGFAGFIIPFGNLIGPLILWVVKKDTMPFVDVNGKNAVNFQITALIAFAVSVVLIFVVIGLFILPVIAVLQIIFMVIAAIKAAAGEAWSYPGAIRFIK